MEQKPDYKIERRYTSYGSLAALGIEVERRRILEPIREKVRIKQKVIQDTPISKLTDALIAILAGAKGLVETNQRVRPEKALQLAFGRRRCAEQSVISDTLNACSNVNVTEMQEAMLDIYRTHSQGYCHDYDVDWQLPDVDMTGKACGKKAEFASKGYFAKQRNRRGRRFGLVTQDPTEYTDVVHRIAVRTCKKNGQWGIGALLSSLSPQEITYLVGLMAPDTPSEQEILAAYVHFYDLRGGGVETAIKSERQALGIAKRNKKSFAAQQMIVQLNALVHNWNRTWSRLIYETGLGKGRSKRSISICSASSAASL